MGHTVGDVIEQDGVQVRVTEIDAEGNAVTVEPVAAAATGEPIAQPTTPDPNAALRTEIDQLRHELRGRTPATPAAPPPAQRPVTEADIEAAYTAGRITLEQRDQAVDDLRFQQRYDRMRASERAQETERDAETTLWDLRKKHPELGQAGSPLLREVEDRLRVMAGRGFDPQRLGTQLTAAEWVLDQRTARAATTRASQTGVPVTTGAASFAGGQPGSPAPRDEYADIPQDVRNYWTRTGVPRDKWGPHAAAYRARQQRKAATFAAIAGRQAG